MKAIDNSPVKDTLFKRGCNCQGFAPKLSYTFTANEVVVKDESVFPTGDTLKRINVLVHDKFGNTKGGTIVVAGGDTGAIDVSGLNSTQPLNITAVIDTNGDCKTDGSAVNIIEAGYLGNFSENYKAELAG